MKAYKGFNRDMTCRGFQYKERAEYEEKEAQLCHSGFHACEVPMDCFNYYSPSNSVYHEVDLEDVCSERESIDTKVCAKRIKIGARLSFSGLVKATIEYVQTKVIATTGDMAHSVTTGYMAHSATTGYMAHSATTGKSARSATTGDGAHSMTSGHMAHSATTGKNSIAAALGIAGKAKGSIGCWIVLAEYAHTLQGLMLIGVKCAKVDGSNILADTWYHLCNGKFEIAKEDDE